MPHRLHIHCRRAAEWNSKWGCREKTILRLRRHAHGLLAERLIHMAHKMVNTSEVFKSSSDWLNSTRFLRDVYAAFLIRSPGNKDAVTPNPLME